VQSALQERSTNVCCNIRAYLPTSSNLLISKGPKDISKARRDFVRDDEGVDRLKFQQQSKMEMSFVTTNVKLSEGKQRWNKSIALRSYMK
jgi:hypothetical protein